MVRARLATLALAAGLGLVSGCASFSDHPLLSRMRHPRAEPGVVEAESPVCEGPMLEDSGTFVVPPGAAVQPLMPQPLMPQPGLPSLAPAPRLVPQPQAPAQPLPYVPPQ